jgi:hypothetical protein
MKKNQILNFIKATKISLLDAFSWITPIAIMIIWAFITDKIFKNHIPQIFHILVLVICFFIVGTGGLFQVIKKEAPWIMGKTIKGNLAVVSGVLGMILFWGLGVLVLYFYLSELSAKYPH